MVTVPNYPRRANLKHNPWMYVVVALAFGFLVEAGLCFFPLFAPPQLQVRAHAAWKADPDVQILWCAISHSLYDEVTVSSKILDRNYKINQIFEASSETSPVTYAYFRLLPQQQSPAKVRSIATLMRTQQSVNKIVLCGWPARAIAYNIPISSGLGAPLISSGVIAYKSRLAGHNESSLWPLPWEIHWFTFCASSALIALVLVCAGYALQMLRRSIRMCLHRCPGCGYSLAHLRAAVCPECGSSPRICPWLRLSPIDSNGYRNAWKCGTDSVADVDANDKKC
jgi:hypothetical protein